MKQPVIQQQPEQRDGHQRGFTLIEILIVLAIVDLVFCIIAAMRANEGERYSYPYTFRFIK